MEETLTKTDAIIDRYNLGDCRKNSTKNFKDRKKWGRCGESLVLEALKLQIIPNHWCQFAPDVEEHNKKQIYLNRRLGDIYFINPKTDNIEHIDVKNTIFISKKSLMDFIEGGWYFLNAFANSGNVHFMIKNNEGFRKWITQREVITVNGSEGYFADYWDIPIDKTAHGIEIFEFDPAAYQSLIMKVRVELEVLRNMTTAEIDKCIPVYRR